MNEENKVLDVEIKEQESNENKIVKEKFSLKKTIQKIGDIQLKQIVKPVGKIAAGAALLAVGNLIGKSGKGDSEAIVDVDPAMIGMEPVDSQGNTEE